jgi:hypothetical protein
MYSLIHSYNGWMDGWMNTFTWMDGSKAYLILDTDRKEERLTYLRPLEQFKYQKKKLRLKKTIQTTSLANWIQTEIF